MIFFGSLFQSKLAHDDQFDLRALWHGIIERLCQRYKLTLSLAVCLCLGSSSVYASQYVLLPEDANTTTTSVAVKNETVSNLKNIQTIENINSLAPTTLLQPELQEPSLYALLDAEFAADRDDKQRAIAIYKQQSFKEDATAVFERALSLSLRNERIEDSLQFAKTWQDQNPDHVPAWFYVAHLALRAHDYLLAGETLNRILRYDPRADLSEILIGIYPNNDQDKRELLAALQPLDSEQNASLSVLKAGLLYQFNEPESAIIHINRALEHQPDYVPLSH